MGCTPNTSANIEQKLKQRTIIDPITNCWLWQGSKTKDGYGTIGYLYKVMRIHRISAHLYLGLDLVDREQHALHKVECKNRHCWNPGHLYIADNMQNVNDRMYNHIPQEFCKYGHKIDGIKTSGLRYCLTCNNIRNRNYVVRNSSTRR